MRTKTHLASRLAAMLLALLVLMHSVLALDLIFNFFPATEEFRVMWEIPVWAKTLWAFLCVTGAVGVFLLYRRPWLGLIATATFTACLYIASTQLWGEVKGGFWIAILATLVAAIGAVRSN